MILQDWWFSTLLGTSAPLCPPLRGSARAEVVVVGGGMAGVSAALRLALAGRQVALLERAVVGGSSTGRSAGFLTPDSELELSQLIRRYGTDGARDVWTVPTRGIALIVENVKRYGIACDLLAQDSLFVGLGRSGRDAIDEERAARRQLGYPETSYDATSLPSVLGTTAFVGGVRYGDTWGINALRYVQGMKGVLRDLGVAIYEGTEVLALDDHTVRTHMGSVMADEIVLCLDKPSRSVSRFADNVYHAQTFLAISEPLSDGDLNRLFPGGPLQCWDSTLVYSYWRLTGDNRLLLGGGSALTTFALQYMNTSRVVDRVIRDFHRRFPALDSLRFTQFWPGLIDTTRDLFPTVARDDARPWIHQVLGCVGLPWAAFCGDFVGRHVGNPNGHDDHHYYRYFRPDRPFLLPVWAEKLLGRPAVFSLNNAWAKYVQVDRRS